MSQFPHFEFFQYDSVTELSLVDTSRFDAPRYFGLQDELFAFVEMYRPKHLVINFDRIRYCSSALINSVIRARRRLDEVGGELKLCGMCEHVRETFCRLNLDGTVFDIHGSEADALAAF